MTDANACPACGTPAANARFCPACGTPLFDTGASALFAHVQGALAREFEVTAEIGRGGMAVVYLARDLRLPRRVALKVMFPELAYSESMPQRFLGEARTAAMLDHPNIVPIYRAGESGGVRFFAMRYIDGCSLDQLLRVERRLPVSLSCYILAETARALDFAHGEGVVHRDVKPGNVMLDSKWGRAIVTDFGIAKVVDGDQLTRPGFAIGTPAYMSPELCRDAAPSAASDQYALGVVAYQLLTGGLPFAGTAFDTSPAARQPTRPVREVYPECPAELDAAVLRMLEAAPGARWPNLGDVLSVLLRHVGGSEAAQQEELRRRLAVLVPGRAGAGTPPSPMPSRAHAEGPEGSRARPHALTLTPREATVVVGGSVRFEAQGVDPDGHPVPSALVAWAADDSGHATVSGQGTASAVRPGVARVTARVYDAEAVATLRVLPAPIAPPIPASGAPAPRAADVASPPDGRDAGPLPTAVWPPGARPPVRPTNGAPAEPVLAPAALAAASDAAGAGSTECAVDEPVGLEPAHLGPVSPANAEAGRASRAGADGETGVASASGAGRVRGRSTWLLATLGTAAAGAIVAWVVSRAPDASRAVQAARLGTSVAGTPAATSARPAPAQSIPATSAAPPSASAAEVPADAPAAIPARPDSEPAAVARSASPRVVVVLPPTVRPTGGAGVSVPTVHLVEGDTVQLRVTLVEGARATPRAVSPGAVRWRSGNTDRLPVDAAGRVWARRAGAGPVHIRASVNDAPGREGVVRFFVAPRAGAPAVADAATRPTPGDAGSTLAVEDALSLVRGGFLRAMQERDFGTVRELLAASRQGDAAAAVGWLNTRKGLQVGPGAPASVVMRYDGKSLLDFSVRLSWKPGGLFGGRTSHIAQFRAALTRDAGGWRVVSVAPHHTFPPPP